jgi:cytochrome c553
MKTLSILFGSLAAAAIAALATGQSAADKDMLWAYPVASAVVTKPPVPAIEGPQQVAGSAKSYTQAELDLMSIGVDWFPDLHAPMPRIVRDGTANGGFACGSCHLATGLGHPESSDMAGLTADYIAKAMAEYRSGVRQDPIRMTAIAKATSEEDVREAARWFSGLTSPVAHWTRVVEAKVVPKTYLGQGRMRFVDPDATGNEPIGGRIISLPEDAARARRRDPSSGFVAYVPPGSVARGKALANGTGGKTLQCLICHGDGLRGVGNIPRIAGQHPIFIFRQLRGFKGGANNGPEAQLMKPVVARLTDSDMVDLAAYVGSLPIK